MTVNDINSSLISAIELLAQKNDSSISTTLTIEATVTATLDSSIGAYTVKYMDSKFTAYALSPDITYSVDDKVYVLVPDGDFTKEKVILTYPTSTVSDETSTADKATVDASGDFLDLPTELFFCTYDTDHFDPAFPHDSSKMTKDRREWNVTFTNLDLYKQVMQDYFDTYGRLRLACKIKTNIYSSMDTTSRQVDGNYGLSCTIKYWLYEDLDRTASTLQSTTVTIDTSNILGDPYNQSVFNTQYIDIDSIPTGATIAVDRDDGITLTYFVEGFSQSLPDDEGYNFDDAGNVISLKDDLFIKDITLRAISVLTEEQLKGYSLQLSGSNGNYLTTDASTYYYNDGTITSVISKEEYNELPDEVKTLYHSKYESTVISPVLKKKGKTLLMSKWPCYWFKEDATVTSTADDGYSSYGGLGWRILNKVKDAESNVYYTNVYEFTAALANTGDEDWVDVVSTAATYKCVLLYDTVTVTDTITIKNIDSSISVSLESVTGSNKVIANSGTAHIRCNLSVSDISGYTFSWARYNRYGTFLETLTALTTAANEVKVPAVYIETMNIIKCTVYKDDTFIGSDSINIITDDSVDYIMTIDNADVLYKYDSDGDSPMSSKYDGTSGSAITSIEPFLLNVYRADGIELVEEEYRRATVTWKLPVNSLMVFDESYTGTKDDSEEYYLYTTTAWASHKAGISYTLASSYKTDLSNNTITVILDFDGSQTSQSSTIMILKDGEEGTNGSAYTAAITFQGLSGKAVADDGTPHKFQLYYDGSSLRYFDYYTGALEKFYDESRASIDEEATRKANRMVLNEVGKFDVKVYYNGDDITSEEDEEYTVSKWAIVNYTNGSKNIISIGTDAVGSSKYYYLYPNLSNWDTSNLCTVLQVQIKIGKTYIYAYYPIEIIRIASFDYDIRYYINGGFTSVMYAADGSSPKYSNSSYFKFYGVYNSSEYEVELDKSDSSKTYVDEDNSALKISHKTLKDDSGTKIGDEYTARPDTTYEGQIDNYIIFYLGECNYVVPVYCYYDTAGYTNMIVWDGSSIQVDNDLNIISSQVLSGVSGDNGFTGLTIGQVSESSSSSSTKNGLMAFRDGQQTAYISADTGAIYLGMNNEIALAVPVPNTEDEFTNTIAGWNVTEDRFYDNNGSSQNVSILSADAAQAATYRTTAGSAATSHLIALRAANSSTSKRTVISYDGSLYSDSGNIGGWIIGDNTLTSQDGTMVINSSTNTISGATIVDPSTAALINNLSLQVDSLNTLVASLTTEVETLITKMSDAETAITDLTARVEALENPTSAEGE